MHVTYTYDGIDVSILCSFAPVLTSLNLQSTFWGLYDYTNITFYMAIRKRSCNGYIFLVIYVLNIVLLMK